MLQAILAALATVAAIIVVVAIVVHRRHRNDNEMHVHPQNMNSIKTFGVSAQGKPASTTPRVKPDQVSGSVPGESMHGRFLAFGVFAAAVFGTLGARLWSMQVLQYDDYRQRSNENLYTTIYTPAPRGIIYDADGRALVQNRTNYVALASSDVANNHDVVLRLSGLLGIPYEVVRQRILDTTTGTQSNRVVADNLSMRNVSYLVEHADAFPGVTTQLRTERSYPYDALAAHVLGYTGTVSDDDLQNQSEGQNYQSGDVVGRSGVEATYEDVLAGDHGTRVVLADANGDVQQVISETDPTRGNDLYLTIKAPVQYAADRALADLLAPDGRFGAGDGTGGCVVCLDARDGGVVALSSCPTFSPSTFTGGVSQDVWDAFNTDESQYPLMDRVVSGTYPAASTFKAFSALAALTDGVATAQSTYNCTGVWYGFGEDYPHRCLREGGHGTLNLQQGIANSCDIVFYNIAKSFWDQRDTLGQDALQDFIEKYGFGQQEGIDLSGEAAGRVPTPEWKANYFRDEPEEGQWVGGDMSNMIIGQGYTLVTPLQIACGYAGIATGTIYRPHLMKEVHNSLGQTVLSYNAQVNYEPDVEQQYLDLVRNGLRDVITVNTAEMGDLGQQSFTVAGKTGTAEVANKDDYAWFVCYAPADNPRYVVACLIEQGVYPGTSAIPVAGTVLKAAMASDDGTVDQNIQPITSSYTYVTYTSSSSNSRSD